MGKPRTPVGTFGEIGVRTRVSGRVAASTRYRDWNGRLRRVEASGDSRRAAERALNAKLPTDRWCNRRQRPSRPTAASAR